MHVKTETKMTEPREQQRKSLTRGGFSLAAMAMLVTTFMALFAASDIPRLRQQYAELTGNDYWQFIGLFVGAAIVGAAIGVLHLFVHGFSWRMLWFAPLSGALAAEVGMLILIAPGPLWRSLLAAGLLIGTTNLLRLGAD